MTPLAKTLSALIAFIALEGCAATPVAPPMTAAASAASPVAQPIAEPMSASASASASAPASTSASPPAKGSLVFDAEPPAAAEVYEDDVPIAVDAGEPIAADAGVHKIELVMNGLVVWSAKIRVPADGAVHVRIPSQYATAYTR
jgi:hypothetical protein